MKCEVEPDSKAAVEEEEEEEEEAGEKIRGNRKSAWSRRGGRESERALQSGRRRSQSPSCWMERRMGSGGRTEWEAVRGQR